MIYREQIGDRGTGAGGDGGEECVPDGVGRVRGGASVVPSCPD
jgi:hypothetical protein